MDIIILLCILLILMFLGGSFFQDGKMYLGDIMRNTVTTIIINKLTKSPL